MRLCQIWIIACLMAGPAFGLDPTHRISPHGHSSWMLKDGAFSGASTSIPNGADVFRDVPVTSSSTHEGLDADLANGVMATRDDALWINTWHSPLFYQTRWFAAACLLGAVGLIWALLAWRVRQIRLAMLGRLEERLIERERIARELHDTFLQSVQGLVLRFHTAIDSLPAAEQGRRMMEQALDSADRVLVEGRDRVAGLRASVEASDDLPQSLREIGEQHEALHGNAFRCTVVGRSRPLHPVPLEEVRRIAAEALVNAFRHAQARQISLTLTYSKSELAVQVADDGVGFDAVAVSKASLKHFGLVGMRERALKIQGRLRLSTRPGAGTVVDLRVPAVIAFHTDAARKGCHRPAGWRRVGRQQLRQNSGSLHEGRPS